MVHHGTCPIVLLKIIYHIYHGTINIPWYIICNMVLYLYHGTVKNTMVLVPYLYHGKIAYELNVSFIYFKLLRL